jgi:CRISPR-associated protein Cas1
MLLMINTYGAKLSRRAGRFCVRSGDKTHLLSPERVESIILTTACSVTTDALLLALEHEIPVLLTSRNGEPEGLFWSRRYGSIATIRRRQLEFSRSPEGTAWMIGVLRQKAEGQMQLLRSLALRRPSRQAGLDACAREIGRQQLLLDQHLGSLPQVCAPSLRGIEGAISQQYFRALSDALPRAWQFSQRSRRPAQDRFNATLNYLYGMLYHLTEVSLLASGLDPYLPVLHADEYARPAFSFDCIERWRPWADEVAVQVCLDKVMQAQHFDESPEQVRLNKAGRKALVPAFYAFLDEKTPVPGGKRSARRVQMHRAASGLAISLLESPPSLN